MEPSEVEEILMKNERFPFSDLCSNTNLNNCKLILSNGCLRTSTLLLGAAHPWLRELLCELPSFLEQTIILPDYADFRIFVEDMLKAGLSVCPLKEGGEEEAEYPDINPILLGQFESQLWKEEVAVPGEKELGNVKDSLNNKEYCDPPQQKYRGKTKGKVREEKEFAAIKRVRRESNNVKHQDARKNREGTGVGTEYLMYSCDTCQRRFNNILGLELHVRKEHDPNANINPYFEYLENGEFRCKFCGFVNGTRSAMRKHCNFNHIRKKQISCEECSKKFCTQTGLKRHMICHSQQKSHFCSVCGEGFVYYMSMKRHYLRFHATAEEQIAAKNRYQCDTCGFSDMFLNRLKRHMETHSTVKNYACEKCGKTFTSKRYLQQHTRQAHVLSPQPAKPKSLEQKARIAARAREYRARKAGKIPDECGSLDIAL